MSTRNPTHFWARDDGRILMSWLYPSSAREESTHRAEGYVYLGVVAGKTRGHRLAAIMRRIGGEGSGLTAWLLSITSEAEGVTLADLLDPTPELVAHLRGRKGKQPPAQERYLAWAALRVPPSNEKITVTAAVIEQVLAEFPSVCDEGLGGGKDAPRPFTPERVQPVVDYLLDHFPRAKQPNREVSSYTVKHMCENRIGRYTTNGELILAAIIAGYAWARIDCGPNAHLGIPSGAFRTARTADLRCGV